MTLEGLIKKYEEDLAAHKSGVMMSMAESVHGEIWCARILEDLRELSNPENIEKLEVALRGSVQAVDDWLHTFAPEHCGEKYVKATQDRISKAGGTVAYIADVQATNRAALGEKLHG